MHDKFIEQKSLEGLAPRSIQDYKMHMEFLRKYIEEEERISLDRLADADVKKMLCTPDKSTYAGYRDFVLMVLMLDTGVRVNEAANIKVEDVDLKLGLINIRDESAKTRVQKQIPISQKTCKLLTALIKIAEQNKSAYVFQSAYGDKLKTNQVIQNFERYCKMAGVTVRCTPHNFRHTFATNAVKAD